MHPAKNAEKALREIIEYRRRLDSDADKELARALDRVVDVLQKHIHRAVLDAREFYETTLLSEDISAEEKTSIALDIAMRWEQIDSSSTALSANSLLERLKPDELVPSARSHSLHHIEDPTRDKPFCQNLPLALRRIHLTGPGGTRNTSPVHGNNQFNSHYASKAEKACSSTDSGRHRLEAQSNERTPHQQRRSDPPRRPRRHRHLLLPPPHDEPDPQKVVGRVPSPSTSSSLESFSRLAGSGPGGQTFHLQLERNPADGFGFSIAGGSDQEPLSEDCPQGFVYVAHITPGGVADRDGRLAVNDRLLSVNGASLIGIPHAQAVSIFERSGPHLDLVIERTYQHPRSKLDRPQVIHSKRHSHFVHQRSTASQRACLSNEETAFDTSGASPVDWHNPERHRKKLARTKPGSQGSLAGVATGSPRDATYLPTTVSPLSSIFTMPCGSSAVRRANEAGRTEPSPRPSRVDVGKEALSPHQLKGTDAGVSEASEDIWLFDPESTLGGHASISAKSSAEMGSCENLSGSLPRRPLPAPPPGPVIVEVPLVRGTRNGFGFSIAGGRDSQYVKGDSGIFITQIAPGGVADTSGRFTIGDRLVRVNGICLDEVTHEEAVNALQSAGDLALLVLVKNERASLRQSFISDYKSMARSLGEFNSLRLRDASLNAQDRNGNRQSAEFPAKASVEAHQSARRRLQSGHRKKVLGAKGSSTSISQLHMCQSRDGLCGRDEYVATTAINESILRRWPKARLVTLFKYNSTASGETKRGLPDSTGGSLGFNIVGGGGTKGIFISHIQPKSPAAISRKIHVGDRLLVVNGVELAESSHEDAAILLKTAPNRVDLVLVFEPDDYKKLEEQFSRQNSNSSGDLNLMEPRSAQSIEAAGLFVRVLADFDPVSMQNEVIPKNALTIHSGDVLQIINTIDSGWWQARRILPSTCKPLGPVGLVPSRKRLKRYVISRRAKELAAWAAIDQRRGAASRPASPTNPHLSTSASPSQSLPSSNNEPSTDRTGNAIESLPLSPATEVSQHGSRSSSSIQSQSKLNRQQSHLSSSPERTTNRSMADVKQASKANSLSKGQAQGSRSEILPYGGPPLTYIPVVAVESVHARPVVILGDLKESLTDDLLSDFPNRFGTCVPFTTRPRRRGEVEGRDYHFCKSRSKMESEIAMNRFVEAGEYNGNLYGTHIQSVFKVAASGLHCLLDVGGPALVRLTKAGLPPIAILVNGSAGVEEAHAVRVLNPSSGSLSNSSKDDSTKAAAEQIRRARIREKTGDFLKHFSTFLTAVVAASDYESAYELVKGIIDNNEGPRVWIASDESLP
ncbi:hypothetical protein AAHC03_010119 [Spirometra sp. Aus1]